jgi:hypothetical protein
MKQVLRQHKQYLLTGVSYVIPMIACGGILIATAIALLTMLYPGSMTSTGGPDFSGAPTLKMVLDIGDAAFKMALPVLAGFIAYGMAGKPGLVPGLLGGYLAGTTNAGFLGALLVGLLAGHVVNLLKKLPVHRYVRPIMPILIVPIVSGLVVGTVMLKVVGVPIAEFMVLLGRWLQSMSGGNAVVLAMILGAMIAFDMGGPVNKAAFFFGAAMIKEGNFAVMGACAAAICTPIERPTNQERQFEVASHQWIDLTDKTGAYGVTVLSDSKNASDKPADNTLRLTLIRTPGIRGGYDDQSSQDLGHHAFIYGLASHAGDWRQGRTDWQAQRLNAPLLAFEATPHAGALGRSFSLVTVSTPRIRVLAIKKAEQSDEIVLRAVELDGKPVTGVRFTFATPLAGAREVNGVESAVGEASVVKGELLADFTPYQVRSFAVKLGAPPAKVPVPASQPVKLTFDQAVASADRSVSGGRFDSGGRSLPAEMLPPTLPYSGITFVLGPASGLNAIAGRGQTIQLPAGAFTRVYLLAAADGDQKAAFRVGTTPVDLTIQDWGGYLGQWDNRIWKSHEEPVPPRQGQPTPAPGTPPRMRTVTEFAGLTPGFVKRTPVAWFASHRHASDGSNDPYAYSYLYAYAIDIPAGATTLTLPANERIKILAVTVSDETAVARPAAPLYDTLVR